MCREEHREVGNVNKHFSILSGALCRVTCVEPSDQSHLIQDTQFRFCVELCFHISVMRHIFASFVTCGSLLLSVTFCLGNASSLLVSVCVCVCFIELCYELAEWVMLQSPIVTVPTATTHTLSSHTHTGMHQVHKCTLKALTQDRSTHSCPLIWWMWTPL